MLQKPDPGHNYAKLMEEYSSKKDGKLPTHTEVTAERSKESRTVTYVAEPGLDSIALFMLISSDLDYRSSDEILAKIFNLIDYSLKEREKMFPNIFDYPGIAYIKIIDLLSLKDFRDKMKYRSSTAKRICSARGDWVLQDSDWNSTEHSTLQSYIVEEDYDQSILLWHIATEFCYNMQPSNGDGCKFSTALSDYMLYFLVMQPTLTSSVAGIGQIRFRDTCAEATKFFSRRELGSGRSGGDC
ncbi:uncharacterized protein Pyn_15038 [Prunus yedoensis var. nudiflora]|uniref:Uncharacterized protein n=1 Tax=Prunus yedoensis var. nudiflora TaxID=2094558 RepID=A0A314ZNN2_PRUYE|nr:uncharacterized protein Pyn_15038 [Prunus yedoensis var. nudiflora]